MLAFCGAHPSHMVNRIFVSTSSRFQFLYLPIDLQYRYVYCISKFLLEKQIFRSNLYRKFSVNFLETLGHE